MSLLDSPVEKGSPRHSSFSASPFGRPSRSTNDVPANPKPTGSQRGFPWANPAQKFPKFSLWSPAKVHKTKEFPFALTDRLYGYVYGGQQRPYKSPCTLQMSATQNQSILFHRRPHLPQTCARDLQRTTEHHGNSSSRPLAPCHPGKPPSSCVECS